ncbi:GntR family transcriptional regulator [Solwaraspora sp. WMMD1047]|uniref:FadR/GntR family transcriptional regulator n=1 Tax=Solwaraspora sp. WMMD1047 TaxID=3016102 RepID=UPI002417B3E1|nr:GntR family transcriptional regulator [Solwaraspora sp. WMMD1047]MDG4830559.1 GntR family transcriptional regulator [Solwaraspora sp. WMMD1047]
MTSTDAASAGRGTRPRNVVALGAVRQVTSNRLADDVAEQIRQLIISKDLAEGSRLPSERHLASMFGASRPIVSQALRSLSLMGLVEIKQGSGAYIMRRPESAIAASVNLMLDLDRQSLSHLVDLRLWLETLGATEGIRQSGADLDHVRTALHRLNDSMAGGTSAWIAADTVFHAAVVRTSGNPFLTSIYEAIHTAVISYEYEDWVSRDRVPEWLLPSNADAQMAIHKPILDAMADRDDAAVRRAIRHHHDVMLQHIERSRESR